MGFGRGILLWMIGRAVADHSFVGNLLASLKLGIPIALCFVAVVPAPCAGIGFYEPATGGKA